MQAKKRNFSSRYLIEFSTPASALSHGPNRPIPSSICGWRGECSTAHNPEYEGNRPECEANPVRCNRPCETVDGNKANRIEAMGVAPEGTHLLAMARRLADEHRCSVVVTYGGHGMVAAERGGGTWYLPAVPTEVRDVCGAGDTVLAALGAGILGGSCLRRACRLATQAGGRQVAELGITPVDPL